MTQSITSRPRLPQYIIKWKGNRDQCANPTAPFACARGKTKNAIVPKWSRPFTNGTKKIDGDIKASGPAFKARPIKHWRKQLAPQKGTGSSSSGIGMPMDIPGGSVSANQEANTDVSGCCNTSDAFVIAEYVPKSPQVPCKPTDILNVSPKCNPENPVFGKKQPCNPVANRIKSATTILNRKYYTDSKAYLRARCRTYNQRLTGTPVPGVAYFSSDGVPLWPSSTVTPGPQSRAMSNCYKECGSKCYGGPGTGVVAITTYKPNNSQFAVQGAVSSGTRVERLRYNTIQKAAAGQKTAWGAQTANGSAYNGNTGAPYTVKSKYSGNTRCINARRRRGNHALCFNAPCHATSDGPFCQQVGGMLAKK